MSISALEFLASNIDHQIQTVPFKVAIDGVDGSGKTFFANNLVIPLEQRGLSVTRVSVDDFLNPKEVRSRRGEYSPDGYYFDSFDYPMFREAVLEPRIDDSTKRNVILVDGVFLHRPEVVDLWDYTIFLEVKFSTILQRVAERDLDKFGSAAELMKRYQERYIPGQKIYLSTVNPRGLANVVIDNNDWASPKLTHVN